MERARSVPYSRRIRNRVHIDRKRAAAGSIPSSRDSASRFRAPTRHAFFVGHVMRRGAPAAPPAARAAPGAGDGPTSPDGARMAPGRGVHVNGAPVRPPETERTVPRPWRADATRHAPYEDPGTRAGGIRPPDRVSGAACAPFAAMRTSSQAVHQRPRVTRRAIRPPSGVVTAMPSIGIPPAAPSGRRTLFLRSCAFELAI